LEHEPLLLPQRGPGPEFLKLLISKFGCSNYRLIHHDVALDRLLTLVGGCWGLLLALEGATGAVYPGVIFREVHGGDRATRPNFSAVCHSQLCSPTPENAFFAFFGRFGFGSDPLRSASRHSVWAQNSALDLKGKVAAFNSTLNGRF
jgi:hypothetical protein